MERYIEIVDGKYYDCLLNKFISSSKRLSQSIKNNLCQFASIYSDEFIVNNIKRTRQQLILSVTEHCNLRCEYCVYYDKKYADNFELNKMSFPVAKKAIDDYVSNSMCSERRCISFYGGEPLLNFDLIQKCVEYIESLNLSHPIDFLITTNGVLLDQSIAHYLYKYKFLVNISMDGPRKIHDRYRKLMNGENTFKKIINNVQYLVSLDPIYWKSALGFLCVLAPPVDINSITDYFELLPYKYTLSNIELTNHMNNIIKNTCIDAKTEYEKIRLQHKERANQGILNEIRFTRNVIENFNNFSQFSPGRYCIPCIKRTFVSVDGDYYICEKDDMHTHRIIGNVDSGINIEKLKQLRDEVLDFHNKNCKTCWAARFCGMCFATIEQFPECCERFKADTKNAMKYILEDSYE